METKPSVALKAGLFVAVGLFLMAVIVFGIESWRIFQPGYHIELLFESASGVLKGAPVKFAGVEVGEVVEIGVERDEGSPTPQVRVKIWLSAHLKIRGDDEAWIGILGLLGEKYVEIQPGSGNGRLLDDGDILVGTGVISELEFTQGITKTISELDGALKRAQELLGNSQLPDRLITTLGKTEQLLGQLNKTAQEADALLEGWQSLTDKTSTSLQRLQTWGPLLALLVILLPVAAMLIVR